MVSFVRRARDRSDFLVVAVNFTPVPREQYVIGVPDAGRYVELLNSDSAIYGGSNVGNRRRRCTPRRRPRTAGLIDCSSRCRRLGA